MVYDEVPLLCMGYVFSVLGNCITSNYPYRILFLSTVTGIKLSERS